MSIATAITAAQGKVANAYTAISAKGGTLPATQNLANMPTAINSIPTGGGGTATPAIFDANYFVDTNGTITNFIEFTTNSSANRSYFLKTFATSFANTTTVHNWLDEGLMEVNDSIQGIRAIRKTGRFVGGTFAPVLDTSTTTQYISFRALEEAIFTDSRQFQNLTSLKKVDLHNAKKIALPMSFVGLSSFEEIDLTSVEDLTTTRALGGTAAIGGAFAGTSITTLSLPSLKSTSFGSYTNQFDYMLKNVTGCTVHFPSNLQSVIGSWSSVTSGFGGTNTTVLFDLPATS